MNTDAVVFKKTAAAAGKIRPVTWLGKRWGNHRLPIRGGNERGFFPTRRIETAPVAADKLIAEDHADFRR